ncbi:hypothetical protein Bpfe_031042 [Biomphalaria pfeifferi]|uniref:Uncharacterized protein n=1 Tax=Biomphalaria pfeifferi TaxID=112525 RepID=A0AAD8ETB1_BIOPF|nr:hypothetical protein Bpfe_031042 [Biomphalaria pfeifferi]
MIIIYHPINKTFHAIKTAEVVRNVEIYETISCNGAVGYTSGSHLWIRDAKDNRGFPVERSASRQNLLTLFDYEDLIQSKILLIQSTECRAGKETVGILPSVSHMIEGDLGKSIVTGASPTHVVTKSSSFSAMRWEKAGKASSVRGSEVLIVRHRNI